MKNIKPFRTKQHLKLNRTIEHKTDPNSIADYTLNTYYNIYSQWMNSNKLSSHQFIVMPLQPFNVLYTCFNLLYSCSIVTMYFNSFISVCKMCCICPFLCKSD